MNVEEIIKTVKEKVGLNDDLAAKVGSALSNINIADNKDGIIKTLTEKVGVSEEIANKIYSAISGALAGGVAEKVKGLFGKN